MRMLIQILIAAAFIAIMLALRWGSQQVDLAWPEHGIAALYTIAMPILAAAAIYIDRKDDGKTKNFWGNPEPSGIAYDLDVIPNTKRLKALRYYAIFGAGVGVVIWFACAFGAIPKIIDGDPGRVEVLPELFVQRLEEFDVIGRGLERARQTGQGFLRVVEPAQRLGVVAAADFRQLRLLASNVDWLRVR